MGAMAYMLEKIANVIKGLVGGVVLGHVGYLSFLHFIPDTRNTIYITIGLTGILGAILGLRMLRLVSVVINAMVGAFAIIFGVDMLTDSQLTVANIDSSHLNPLGWGLIASWLALTCFSVFLQRWSGARSICISTELASPLVRIPTARPMVSSMYASEGPISGPPSDFRGLSNIGNSCFMNATIQALFSVVPTEACTSMLSQGHVGSLVIHILSSLSSGKNVDSTVLHQMLESVGFDDGKQHDASEFMRFVLNALIDEGPKEEAVQPNRIRDLFLFKTVGVVTCDNCSHQSLSHEDAVDLQVVLPHRCSSGPLSLSELLTAYFEPTRLEGENLYECDNCSSHSPATKVTKLVSLPRILPVSLGRFRYSTECGSLDKVADPVNIPEQLPIAGCHYTLQAVIVHSGSSAEGGHYYALANVRAGGESGKGTKQWCCFDDRSVEECSFSR